MGQKTNPVGLRTAVTREWLSKWYAPDREFAKLLAEDQQIRQVLKRGLVKGLVGASLPKHVRRLLSEKKLDKGLESAAVPRVQIERAANRCRVTIFTARPGVVIGRKGEQIDTLKESLSRLTGKEVYVDIQEVTTPELDAQLVAENIAMQLERRIGFRRAMKKAVQTAMDCGAEGIKIRCAGRLGGAELARVETYHEGRVPLHTLRARIDYGFAEARTLYGKLGVKCWICRGEGQSDRVTKRPVQGASGALLGAAGGSVGAPAVASQNA